ncbi:MAG TPA: hypothetical protein VII42_08495 [Caulobacteraceae bacterium]
MLDAKIPTSESAQTPTPLAPGHVWCRITKMGHDKVFTGATRAPIGRDETAGEGSDTFPRHAFGEMVQLPLIIAQIQEDLGHLEIQD